MKKVIILLSFLLSITSAQSQTSLEDVGIAKYAVLEVLDDRTPLREKTNENSNRITHLFKNAVLFADKQTQDYYRVELKENNFAWINKKFVEVQAIIPEKRFDNIEKIIFKKYRNYDLIKIETPSHSPFIVKEDGANLDLTLFDNRFDPTYSKIINYSYKFSIPNKITNEFDLKYYGTSIPFGYDFEKTNKGYIFKIKKAPKIIKNKPLKNITVVVDAGPGGEEMGVQAFGLNEKDINLQISKILKKELEKKGAKVYLTRKKDKTVSLIERINFAKEKKGDILLSIHQNSLANIKNVDIKHGTGTYYYHPQAKPLAEKIHENMLLATNFKDDKVNHASFALTRPTSQISVLVECGYLIKADEAFKLKDKEFQKGIAKAITKGTEEYLIENYGNL